MNNNINSSIAKRRSALAFLPKALTSEQINNLFEAARWAPSSFNEQPWRFYFASREKIESFDQLLSVLAPGNSEWAKNSSLIVISTAKTKLSLNGKENGYAKHDTGLATSNLLIQAESMGLASHVMGGFDRDKAKDILNLDEDTIPVAAIAIGFHGDLSSLSESNIKRATAQRVRKSIEEISFEI